MRGEIAPPGQRSLSWIGEVKQEERGGRGRSLEGTTGTDWSFFHDGERMSLPLPQGQQAHSPAHRARCYQHCLMYTQRSIRIKERPGSNECLS